MNSAPLLPDYFHHDSISLASMISGAMQIISGLLSGVAMPLLRNSTNNAVPFYFGGVVVLLSAANCVVGLKDVILEKIED